MVSGIDYYTDWLFLDSERIIFKYRNLVYDNVMYVNDLYKIINLKEYKYILGLNNETVPLVGDNKGKPDIVYMANNVSIVDGKIHFTYQEAKEIQVIDNISGNRETKYEYYGTYYYDLDIDTYEILRHGKL